MKIEETKPIQLARRRFLTGAAALLSASYLPNAWPKALPPRLPIPALVDGILLLTLSGNTNTALLLRQCPHLSVFAKYRFLHSVL